MPQAASPSIDHLEQTWRSIDELCTAFTDEEWKRPTGCPGWSVQDQLAHLVDYEAGAVGRPRPEHVATDLSHTKNALGEMNEPGVDYRRTRTGAEVLDEFRSVMADRLAQLQGLGVDDLGRPVDTPAGPGTLADMLTLRVMDTWSHEQDIRRAVGRPGHASGPAVDEAVRYWSRFLPYVVGKKAGAPDGATVVFDVGGVDRIAVGVTGGRAALLDDAPPSPTVTLAMPATTFAALVGGRSDAPSDVVVDGDADLGRRVVEGLGFLP
jgi:uncharacterized protein (TIGR03083 family)